MAPFLNASSTGNFQTEKDSGSCSPIFKTKMAYYSLVLSEIAFKFAASLVMNNFEYE